MISEKLALIVDNEENELILLKKLIEKLGFRVLTASSGQEARKIINEQGEQISLVTTDWVMEQINTGLELVRFIRLHDNSAIANTPVIMITGKSEEDENMAKLAGADRFFRKPVDFKDLKQAVSKLVP